MSERISEKQQKALAFIQAEIRSKGRPPTLREIGQHIGVSSTNGVRYMLEVLQKRGFLHRSPMLSRAITLAPRYSVEPPSQGTIAIPVIGRVAAGLPLLAAENLEGHVCVDRTYVATAETFALRVRGDSMTEAGIFDNDVVFARPQTTAESGDIIVALIGEEATIKYFKQQTDRVLLEPANQKYTPLVVDPSSPNFRILGKVIGLIRKL